jgi:hypothetical protein
MQVLQYYLCSVSMLCHMQIIITHVLFTIQIQSCIMFTHSKPHVLIHRLTTHYLNSTYHLFNYNCIFYITTTAGNTTLQIYLNYTLIFISYDQFLFIFLITWSISIIFSHHSLRYWKYVQTYIIIQKYHWLDKLLHNTLIIKILRFLSE